MFPFNNRKLLCKLLHDGNIGGNKKIDTFSTKEQEILSQFSLYGYVQAFKNGNLATPHNNSGPGKFYYEKWKEEIEGVDSIELTAEGAKEANKYYNIKIIRYCEKSIFWMILSCLLALLSLFLIFITNINSSIVIIEIINNVV